MITFQRVAAGLFLVLAGGCLSGCGGGNVGLSGPDAQTTVGLGTLIVSVQGDIIAELESQVLPLGTLIVSVQGQGVGLVFFQQQMQRTIGGKAYFYNIAPGRYTVGASLELHATLLGYAWQDVDVIADKTVRLSLHPSPINPTPFATSRPFAFKE